MSYRTRAFGRTTRSTGLWRRPALSGILCPWLHVVATLTSNSPGIDAATTATGRRPAPTTHRPSSRSRWGRRHLRRCPSHRSPATHEHDPEPESSPRQNRKNPRQHRAVHRPVDDHPQAAHQRGLDPPRLRAHRQRRNHHRDEPAGPGIANPLPKPPKSGLTLTSRRRATTARLSEESGPPQTSTRPSIA